MLQKSNCCVEAVSLKKWFLWGTLSSPKLKPPEKFVIYARREIFIWKRGIFRCLEIGYSPIQKKGDLVEMTTRRHLLSLVVIRCHLLSFDVTHCQSLCHSLSLVVTRWTNLCHPLCYLLLFVFTRCNLLSFVAPLVVTWCINHLPFYKQILKNQRTFYQRFVKDGNQDLLFKNYLQ